MEKPMAPDERDRSFDKVLARHLRSAAPAGQAAGMPDEFSSQGRACPDPETLAAYHERSLLPQQLNSLKEHIVGCANCQTVLAHLETTDEIPLQAAQEDQVFAQTASAPVISASSQAQAPSKSAAALTRPQPPVREYAASNGRGVSDVAKQSEKSGDAAETRSTKSSGDEELSARKDDQRKTATDLLAAANERDLDAKNLPDALRKKEQEKSNAGNTQAGIVQSQNAQTQNQYNYAPQKVTGPSPLNQAEVPKRAKATAAAAPVPAAPQPKPEAIGGAVSSYNSSDSFELSGAISNPRLISPPGSNLIWRVGRTGSIELSKDSGSSWSRQTSGVLADLLTGAAPSDQVCWIVGRVGAVLLTTDGGAHWKIVASPLAEDLGGVRAFDALHATIWDARSTTRFETSDGGLTWKPVAHP